MHTMPFDPLFTLPRILFSGNIQIHQDTAQILDHWNVPKCPSVGNTLRKSQHSHICSCYHSCKRNEIVGWGCGSSGGALA